MEKELEALERLKTAPSFMGGTVEYRLSSNSQATLLEDYQLVKQALTTKSKKEQAFDVIKAQCVFWFEFNYLTEEWEISIYGERGMSENGIMIKVPKNIGDLLKEVLKND